MTMYLLLREIDREPGHVLGLFESHDDALIAKAIVGEDRWAIIRIQAIEVGKIYENGDLSL